MMSELIRNFIRKCRAFLVRHYFGLRFVHPTFLASLRSKISSDLKSGVFTYIGPDCLIGPGVELGNYSMIGPNVIIAGNDHIYDLVGTPIIFSGRPIQRPTVIGIDCWVGAGAILMRGISVGDASIIAAGSVVVSDVPDGVVYGGVPAKKIKNRFPDDLALQKHLMEIKSRPQEKNYCAPLR